MSKKKKSSRGYKYIKNAILFFLLVFITFYILFQGQDINNILNIIGNVKIQYILIGVLCMLGYFTCETLNLRRTLSALGEKVRFLRVFRYTLIGFFYSSITPAATGGQPMQIYYMHRDGIKAANSTLALVLNLFSFQVVTIGLALISVCFLGGCMDTPLIVLFIVGIALNSTALLLLVVGIFSKKLSTWFVNVAIKFVKKFNFKNADEKVEQLQTSLEKYNGSAKYIRNNRRIIVRQFATAIIQQILYYSIPFFVYLSFGLSEISFIKMLGLQAIVYATVSGIPSPGAVGVSEGAAMSIFKQAFGESMIASATLLNRGISFYLYVVISCVVVMVSSFRAKKEMCVEEEEGQILEESKENEEYD